MHGDPGYILRSSSDILGPHEPICRTVKRHGLHFLSVANQPSPSQLSRNFTSALSTTWNDMRLRDLSKQQLDRAIRQKIADLQDFDALHRTFAHASIESLKHMQDYTTTLDWQPVRFPTSRKDAPPCSTCLKNHNKAPYSSTTRRAHLPGQHLFLDLVEFSPMHLGRYKWFLVCYDFGSAYAMGCPIQHKDLTLVEAIRCIERFETVFAIKPLAVTYDEGELSSNAFRNYLTSKGIDFQPSLPGESQMNAPAERFIQTLTRKVRVMLTDSKAPL
ncbi:hypothetical protein HDU98_006063, partial [Podochytrium sp. JEL0797]